MIGKKSSPALSVKSSERVRGYEVRRLPLGEYVQVMEALRELPQTVLDACFPGLSAPQMLQKLKGVDREGLAELCYRALDVAPGEALRLLSLLTGVPEDALFADPAIGLDGAMELLEAFWRLNGIENFIQAVRRLAAQARALRAKAGSSV